MPLIVIEVPALPEVGVRLIIDGVTVNVTPLLVAPPTVTVTAPVDAPVGTAAIMVVLFQLVGAAGMPLNETVLVP